MVRLVFALILIAAGLPVSADPAWEKFMKKKREKKMIMKNKG